MKVDIYRDNRTGHLVEKVDTGERFPGNFPQWNNNDEMVGTYDPDEPETLTQVGSYEREIPEDDD